MNYFLSRLAPFCIGIFYAQHMYTIPPIKKNLWHEGAIPGYIGNNKIIQEHIKAWHHYIPSNADGHSLIILIHGTGALDAGWYKRKGHPQFEGFLAFAENHAQNMHKVVDCLSFGWSGGNTIEDRLSAAEVLASLINRVSIRYSSITLLGHSHGSNVALAASQKIKSQISLILLAAPMRNGNESFDPREAAFSPGKSVSRIYNIYSPADILQQLGSIRSGLRLADFFAMAQSVLAEGSARKIKHTIEHSYNIQVSVDGKNPGHKEIRFMAPYFAQLFAIIEKNGEKTGDFDAAIETRNGFITLSAHLSAKNLGFIERLPFMAWRSFSMVTALARDFLNRPIDCGKK